MVFFLVVSESSNLLQDLCHCSLYDAGETRAKPPPGRRRYNKIPSLNLSEIREMCGCGSAQTGKDLRVAHRQADDAGAGMRTQYGGYDGNGVEGAIEFAVHRLA